MKKLLALLAVAMSALFASPALATGTATGPDYSALTNAIDFSTTTAAILSVGGLLIVIAVTVMGVRKILRMVRGG